MRGDHWKTRDTYGEGKKVSFCCETTETLQQAIYVEDARHITLINGISSKFYHPRSHCQRNFLHTPCKLLHLFLLTTDLLVGLISQRL